VVPSILTTTHPACPGPPKISCSEKKINVALDQFVIQKEAIANPLGELIVKLKIKRKIYPYNECYDLEKFKKSDSTV